MADRYQWNYKISLQNGRVRLPAPIIKSALERNPGKIEDLQFYLCEKDNYVSVYDEKIDDASPAKFSSRCLVLPREVIQKAGLFKKVILIGVIDYFEIHSLNSKYLSKYLPCNFSGAE